MMAQGVGVRLSVLVGLVWVASTVAGCSSRGDDPARAEGSSGSRVAGEAYAGDRGSADRGVEPERVVQRMAPAPVSSGASSGAASASSKGTAAGAEPAKADGSSSLSGATARNSVASGALASDRPRSSGAEAISPKHLEAELNRLEAEIGN
jgi:hypothetical protein